MTEEPNLKEIERRAYMSYHQDGLLDIFVGVYILAFGIGVHIDVAWEFGFGMIMTAILVVAMLPIWIAAKRSITMPRIGFVKFGPRGSTSKMMALFIGLAVAGLGVSLVFTLALSQGGSLQWLDLIFQNWMLIVGFVSLAVCILFGYSMGLKRLYAYGFLAMLALVIGHFLGISFVYILMALGFTITVVGSALLVGFVRKYPLKGDTAIAE